MRIFFLYFILCISVVSCCTDDDPLPPKEVEQTLFIYMPWSTNLTSYFQRNISDIEKSIQEKGLENERVLVYFMTSPTEATLYELTCENEESVELFLRVI